MSGAIGKPVSRVDGPAKVTGAARYSGDIALAGLAHAQIVGATVASGRIISIDAAAAQRAGGVAGANAPRDALCEPGALAPVAAGRPGAGR